MQELKVLIDECICPVHQTQDFINTVNIINDLNEKRLAINSSALLFYYDATWNSAVKADLFNMLDTAGSGNDTFIVAWYLPSWGYQAYIVNGQYIELANGDVGTTYFGRINRGTTISTPQFAKSGVIDTTTWDVLSSVFVGVDAISAIDSYLHNHSSATIDDAFDFMV